MVSSKNYSFQSIIVNDDNGQTATIRHNGRNFIQSFISMINMKRLWNRTLFLTIVILNLINLSQSQQQIDNVNNKRTFTNQQHHHQMFLLEPENLTVHIGQSILLPCRVANRIGTVQWTRDGFGLGEDPKLPQYPRYTMLVNEDTGDYSLKISSVTLEDDAVFQCQVSQTSKVRGIRSQSAQLTVIVKPEDPMIKWVETDNNATLSHDQDLTTIISATIGTEIYLKCQALGGKPAAQLQWINTRNRVVKKGLIAKSNPLSDGKRYDTVLSLQYEPSKSDHNKRLTCRSDHPSYKNYTKAPTTSILLDIKYPPEVKLEIIRISGQKKPKNLASLNFHGRVGDTLKFKCIVDANPNDSMIFEWLKGNEIIIGHHNRELIIENIDKTWNNVDITCKVSNRIGTGSAFETLNIEYGPMFLPSMEYVYGCNKGDTVKLYCPADSNPSPDVTWIKVGTSSVLSTDTKLTIRNVNNDSIGQYLCRVSVKNHPEISAIIHLKFNGPPKIQKSAKYFYALKDEKAQLECLVESVPLPKSITWIHNGEEFVSGSARLDNIEVMDKNYNKNPFIKASFTIERTIDNDFGYYNCVIVNSYGTDWHLITLNEKTSFFTLAIFIALTISIMLFILISTIVFLLSIRRRKFLLEETAKTVEKKHADPANGNEDHIYSTNSTRTNSSSEKNAPMDTGTLITRYGGSSGSRSSASSFPSFTDNNNHSPASLNFGDDQHNHLAHHLHHHHHHPVHPNHAVHHHNRPLKPYIPGGIYSWPGTRPLSSRSDSPLKTEVLAMPSINSEQYSMLNKVHHLPFHSALPTSHSGSMIRDSYSPYVSNVSILYHPTTHRLDDQSYHNSLDHTVNDMYHANPYQVLSNNNNNNNNNNNINNNPNEMDDKAEQPISSISRSMPTPTPSLARELDLCIAQNSIATHV